MLTGKLYGQTITAKTFSELKRKASRIANGYFKAMDIMEVITERGLSLKFYRHNNLCANNTIVYGQWK